MTVFVVLEEEWGWYQLSGVYATPELADAAVAEFEQGGGYFIVDAREVEGAAS